LHWDEAVLPRIDQPPNRIVAEKRLKFQQIGISSGVISDGLTLWPASPVPTMPRIFSICIHIPYTPIQFAIGFHSAENFLIKKNILTNLFI
jgi:hypothetical protein